MTNPDDIFARMLTSQASDPENKGERQAFYGNATNLAAIVLCELTQRRLIKRRYHFPI